MFILVCIEYFEVRQKLCNETFPSSALLGSRMMKAWVEFKVEFALVWRLDAVLMYFYSWDLTPKSFSLLFVLPIVDQCEHFDHEGPGVQAKHL